MKIKILVEFLVDEEDILMAETEVEAQLNDMINSSTATIISGFQILDSETIKTENEEDF